jgi:hypothetical protein
MIIFIQMLPIDLKLTILYREYGNLRLKTVKE